MVDELECSYEEAERELETNTSMLYYSREDD